MSNNQKRCDTTERPFGLTKTVEGLISEINTWFGEIVWYRHYFIFWWRWMDILDKVYILLDRGMLIRQTKVGSFFPITHWINHKPNIFMFILAMINSMKECQSQIICSILNVKINKNWSNAITMNKKCFSQIHLLSMAVLKA